MRVVAPAAAETAAHAMLRELLRFGCHGGTWRSPGSAIHAWRNGRVAGRKLAGRPPVHGRLSRRGQCVCPRLAPFWHAAFRWDLLATRQSVRSRQWARLILRMTAGPMHWFAAAWQRLPHRCGGGRHRALRNSRSRSGSLAESWRRLAHCAGQFVTRQGMAGQPRGWRGSRRDSSRPSRLGRRPQLLASLAAERCRSPRHRRRQSNSRSGSTRDGTRSNSGRHAGANPGSTRPPRIEDVGAIVDDRGVVNVVEDDIVCGRGDIDGRIDPNRNRHEHGHREHKQLHGRRRWREDKIRRRRI